MKTQDILDELAARQRRTDAMVMDSAAAEIIRLRAQVRSRGKLLEDIFNHPDIELPADIHRRVDRVLMFAADSNLPMELAP